MSLLGGAECSTASNPLSQFSKHVHDDRSQYLERLTGSRADGGSQSIRDKAPVGGQDAMLEGFLQSPDRSLSNPVTALPATFDQIRQELSNLPLSSDPRVGASTEWTAEFNRSDIGAERGMEMGWEAAASAQLDLSAAESVPFDQLASSQRTYTATSISSAPTMAQQSQQQRPLGRPMMGSWLSPLNMGTYSSTMTSPLRAGMTARPMEGKGKGRLVELDDDKWEAQFAQVDDAQRQDHDRDATARAAMAQELEEMDRVGTNDTSDLDGLWRGIHAETGRQLDELLRGEDIGMNIKANEMGDMYLTNEDMQGLRIHDGFSTDPDMGEYIFEEDNPFQDMADPFAEGMRIMEEGGNLSLAALAFEAVVRKDPEHVQAWTMLGNAQAQNEKESPAIRALERALRLDPTNLSALMGLAVSYTNEGYDMSAYRTLERWLATKYPDIVQAAVPPKPAEDIDMMFSGRVQFATHLRSMFIQAAQLSPAGEAMDPDVQVGLGVLFYGAEEHDKAVDCFSAALASTETGTSNGRTQRHLLWNRLGATLANSGRSEEAIAAYEEALRLRPNFVRARYNLGVSCINIGVLEAAAQHLLGALAMHKIMVKDGMERRRGLVQGGLGNVENTIPEGDGIYGSLNPSTNLFDTLRRVFVQMGRSDMAGLVGPSIDLDMFRKDFDF
ncbi:MAG: hypothetical protein M1823_003801 [Watsoniomyces obsoletus]|nr:MAG: hypothetical protein M1823_003801 [Watsoniomyces obsoletus]